MEDIFNLVLITDALMCGNGPENKAASRTTLPQGVDKPSDLLVVLLSNHAGTKNRICIVKYVAGMRMMLRLLLIGVPLICASL